MAVSERNTEGTARKIKGSLRRGVDSALHDIFLKHTGFAV